MLSGEATGVATEERQLKSILEQKGCFASQMGKYPSARCICHARRPKWAQLLSNCAGLVGAVQACAGKGPMMPSHAHSCEPIYWHPGLQLRGRYLEFGPLRLRASVWTGPQKCESCAHTHLLTLVMNAHCRRLSVRKRRFISGSLRQSNQQAGRLRVWLEILIGSAQPGSGQSLASRRVASHESYADWFAAGCAGWPTSH